jgi:hypothetical protein
MSAFKGLPGGNAPAGVQWMYLHFEQGCVMADT